MSDNFKRTYDVAMSDELRVAVIERRRNPDGQLLDTKIEMRGDTEILTYPWHQMKLGDFFFVPLRGRKPGPLSVRLRQAAARRDWELTIVQRTQGSEPCLRVCLTLLDVSQIKGKAQQHHDVRGISYSDGKWSKVRKARYLRAKGTPKLKVIPTINPPQELVDALEQHADKLVKDIQSGRRPIIVAEPEQSDLGVDVSLSPEYDRAKVVRDRLASLGIGAKP